MIFPTLSLSQARLLTLNAGAGFARSEAKGPEGVTQIVDRIGFVQVDTISVVERAHHHVLAVRVPSYRTDWLEKADVFEYWAHAAAYLPWRDFRYTLARKNRILQNGHDWFRVDPAETTRVLDRIRLEGGLQSRDFVSGESRSGWWDWAPSKRALEFLFMSGQVMIRRSGFQKVFDLTERMLPPHVSTHEPSPTEMAHWYIKRALTTWGLAARDEMAYLRREHTEFINPCLKDLEEAKEITKVTVERSKTPYWVTTASLERIDALPRPDRRLRIVSPFDPFLIHRKRMARLFGWNFTLECYMPESKRTFGYFALPLVQGDQVVGLLDAKANRNTRKLEVRNLQFDGPTKHKARFEKDLQRALVQFARFNGVDPPKNFSPSSAETPT